MWGKILLNGLTNKLLSDLLLTMNTITVIIAVLNPKKLKNIDVFFKTNSIFLGKYINLCSNT